MTIRSIVEVNRLFKKNLQFLQYFGNIIYNILFVIWQDFVMFGRTHREIWSHCSGLLTALVLSNSVAR